MPAQGALFSGVKGLGAYFGAGGALNAVEYEPSGLLVSQLRPHRHIRTPPLVSRREADCETAKGVVATDAAPRVHGHHARTLLAS